MTDSYGDLWGLDVEITSKRMPEVGLWAAVMIMAITDYESGLKVTHKPRRRDPHKNNAALIYGRQAQRWIFSAERADLPNSFESVCSMIGLDPSRVRTALREKYNAGEVMHADT